MGEGVITEGFLKEVRPKLRLEHQELAKVGEVREREGKMVPGRVSSMYNGPK